MHCIKMYKKITMMAFFKKLAYLHAKSNIQAEICIAKWKLQNASKFESHS